MSNHLSGENSPYLLQHADNPVDWFPWGEEALRRARQEDKPIFLSIGYAACHWCHVMAHESFEDKKIADYLNAHFINIKVDREERPDLDAVYMNAVVSITGQGGWPMSLFLTPDGKPFFGGTYFPPIPRYGMPAFSQIIESVVQSWHTERDSIKEMGQRLIDHINTSIQWKTPAEGLDNNSLEKAEHELLATYDWQEGGWGRAPKFPRAMAIDFLLQRAVSSFGNLGSSLQPSGLKAACHALDAMSLGGMYDLVGGGFHRYSTDAVWLIPHFEKMLYDNALLAIAYLHAGLITGEHRYLRICEQTLDFILGEMTHPQGGFFSSLDADTGGKEGISYTWEYGELVSILKDDFDFISHAFDISPQGNFEGRVIIRRTLDDQALSEQLNLPIEHVRQKIDAALHTLHEVRQNKPRPGIDDKILTGWNGLALRAFSEAARYLHRPDYLDAARKNAIFLLDQLVTGKSLSRSWRNGQARHPAVLEDYASLTLGLLSLYQASPEVHWYQAALTFASEITNRFTDSAGGFFDSQPDQDLPVRPKDYQDNATPSGNALAALSFLWLSDFSGNMDYRDRAEQMVGAVQKPSSEYPTGFGFWLQAINYAVGPVLQIALLGSTKESLAEFSRMVNEKYLPLAVIAASLFPPNPEGPYLLQERPLVGGATTAYVCRQFICNLPAHTSAELKQQLENPTGPG